MMAVDNATVIARPHSAEDLDEVFDALAHQYRRVIIEGLEWGEPRSLDDLVDMVADEDASSTATDVRIALVHNHLPYLEAAGVITYDDDEAQMAELDDAVAERAVLTAIDDAD